VGRSLDGNAQTERTDCVTRRALTGAWSLAADAIHTESALALVTGAACDPWLQARLARPRIAPGVGGAVEARCASRIAARANASVGAAVGRRRRVARPGSVTRTSHLLVAHAGGQPADRAGNVEPAAPRAGARAIALTALGAVRGTVTVRIQAGRDVTALTVAATALLLRRARLAWPAARGIAAHPVDAVAGRTLFVARATRGVGLRRHAAPHAGVARCRALTLLVERAGRAARHAVGAGVRRAAL